MLPHSSQSCPSNGKMSRTCLPASPGGKLARPPGVTDEGRRHLEYGMQSVEWQKALQLPRAYLGAVRRAANHK